MEKFNWAAADEKFRIKCITLWARSQQNKSKTLCVNKVWTKTTKKMRRHD